MSKCNRIKRNAIMLAAGLGSRLRPFTDTTPKSLLPINGKPIIEYNIETLLRNNITDITIVVGYLGKQFNYLKYKYMPYVTLVDNPNYEKYNSIWSMYRVLDKLGNTYVLDADLLITDDRPFKYVPTRGRSAYYVTQRFSTMPEWFPTVIDSKVTEILVGINESGYSMSGISYWTARDSKIIKSIYDQYCSESLLTNCKLYWDDIPRSILKELNVTTVKVKRDSVKEIDTIEDYSKLMSSPMWEVLL